MSDDETETENENENENNDHDEVIMKEKENTLSPSSSLTSGTDVYMDAVDILNDDQDDHRSGKRSPSTIFR